VLAQADLLENSQNCCSLLSHDGNRTGRASWLARYSRLVSRGIT